MYDSNTLTHFFKSTWSGVLHGNTYACPENCVKSRCYRCCCVLTLVFMWESFHGARRRRTKGWEISLKLIERLLCACFYCIITNILLIICIYPSIHIHIVVASIFFPFLIRFMHRFSIIYCVNVRFFPQSLSNVHRSKICFVKVNASCACLLLIQF